MYDTMNGFLWPTGDTECRRLVFAETAKLDKALKYVAHKRVCVQAGGNCGVFPKYLSPLFGMVYSFEPHPENFHCLAHNVPESNVVKLQAALGDRHGMIRLELSERERTNYGAFYMRDGGEIPLLRVDDLDLAACDLLVLDIEGAEAQALRGAASTIRRFHPVIMIEEKGLSSMFDEPAGAAEAWCAANGYSVAERMPRDIIFV